MHIDDIEVLYFIQKTLGVGKVSPNGVASAIFRVRKQEDVAKIIDIFSKSIFSSVFYTTSFMKYFIQWRNFSTTSLPKLDPDWITGFSDGEGCFLINIIRNPKFKMGWYVQPCFCIVLHEKDRTTLELIKSYFCEVGNITKNSKNCLQYRVTSLQDLINVIIPHFDKYPLVTQKWADFELFKQVVDLLNRKEHLTIEGLQQIVNIKATMNRGLSDVLKKAFPKIITVQRPLVSGGL